MHTDPLVIRDLTPTITTFTVPFNRFAPFGYRKFVAVGNRATAIRLPPSSTLPPSQHLSSSSSPNHAGTPSTTSNDINTKNGARILLLNPIQLTPQVRKKLDDMGGVHFISADLGHHMYVKQYVDVWPDAKTIGVAGLGGKRKDVRWDYVFGGEHGGSTGCDGDVGTEGKRRKPEEVFEFEAEVESVWFEGFITRGVAWWVREGGVLVVGDFLMNLPAKEQYHPSSASCGPFSSAFAARAHPHAIFFKRLIYYVACVDYALMRRDVKTVCELGVQRIVPCHGDVIDEDAAEAWKEVNAWYLQGSASTGWWWRWAHRRFMTGMRWVFLL